MKKMIRRIRALAVAAFLLLVVLSPAPLQAQGELVIIESSASIQFPTSIGFTLAAESSDDIPARFILILTLAPVFMLVGLWI